MNILEIQAELEYWPDQKLIQEAQQPTGAAPTYLVITEGERRNQVRQDYEARLAQQEQPQTTVAEETMMELGGGQPMGGIPDVDPNLMQNQMQDQIMAQQMPQQQMPQQMPQGPPMAMRGGGAIRYQGAGQIAPYTLSQLEESTGLGLGEEGTFVETDEGWKVIGPGGLLMDTDVWFNYKEGSPYSGKPGSRAVMGGLDVLKGKLIWDGTKWVARKAASKFGLGSLKDAWRAIKPSGERYQKFVSPLRERLGGTRTTANVPNPGNWPGTPTITRQTTPRGKAVNYLLDNPYWFGGPAVGLLGMAAKENLGQDVEAQPLETLNEAQQAELELLKTQASIQSKDIFGGDTYDAYRELSDLDKYKFLTMPSVRAKLNTEGLVAGAAPSAGGGTRSGSRVMEEIESILGSGDQALRDQQSAALVQLGAGIAAGDIAGGLSSAGREVSALKAARSAEKIKGIMALIEMQYRQGLLASDELEGLVGMFEALSSAIGQGTEKLVQDIMGEINTRLGGLRNRQAKNVLQSAADRLNP